MRRFVYLSTAFVAAGLFAAMGGLGACGPAPAGADAGKDAGADAGAATDGGGGGTITTNSTKNALPPAWTSATATDFASDNSGAAKGYLNQIVQFTAATTTTGGSGQCTLPCTGCPTNFIYTSTKNGKSYCDGFTAATAAGGTVYGDDFAYFSCANPCACSGSFNGGNLASLRGVWQDHYNSANTTDTYSVGITDCSDVGVGTAPWAGYTGTAGTGTVAALLASSPANGATVTARGVVVAAWSASGGASFGFALEDPSGALNSGIAVGKASSSTSTAAPPSIGDDVTVTGTMNSQFPPNLKIEL